jgi:hypothetical protein
MRGRGWGRADQGSRAGRGREKTGGGAKQRVSGEGMPARVVQSILHVSKSASVYCITRPNMF